MVTCTDMNPFDQLTELLRQLPGIGPRQARRLAYYLVRKDAGWVKLVADTMMQARGAVHTCTLCKRLFPTTVELQRCGICSNTSRDTNTLLLVEKDVDLENIERTGVYKGRYFVLGGTASLLDKEPEKKIRIRALLARLGQEDEPVAEVIFALSATTEGEDTAALVREQLAPFVDAQSLRVSVLGRGLSTGTELEYVDADTMQSALRGRN